MSIKARLVARCAVTAIVCGAVLFLPAGSFRFWQAWIFLALFLLPMFFFSGYFYTRDQALMQRRLQSREKVSQQRIIMGVARLLGLLASLLPGFDYRFGWSRRIFGAEPLWLMIAADVLFLAGYLVTYWVMTVNSYASRTIQVAAGQQVISSGPYKIVRHPMYLGALFSVLAIPLVLGSYVAWPAYAVVIVPALVLRLLNEEKVLSKELPGYSEYCEKTHYRLVPLVW
jgi:protein-S-isoprenylcysteine O-methyltransferase Ste14